MHAIVGFTLVPIDAGISVSPYVAAIERVLEESGLTFEVNCNSTNVEGEWDAVFAAIKRCHEVVHGEGAPRIHTCLQVGTRVDREQRMAEKLESVERRRHKSARCSPVTGFMTATPLSIQLTGNFRQVLGMPDICSAVLHDSVGAVSSHAV